MSSTQRALIAFSLAGMLSASAAHAAGYDATADFQTLSNPGGVWSYGYSPSAGSGYGMTLFDLAGAASWSMSNYGNLGTPAAFMNLGPAASGVATGQLALHPGPLAYGDLAMLRFTAPAAGSYAITGQFFAGDIGSMQGLIIANDDAAHPLQSFANTTDASVFAPLTLTLAAGAHVDFAVGNNGNFLYGSTPLTVQIEAAPVPEPGSVLLMLSGLAWMAVRGGRRRVR
jgi:hypothetical protein